MSHSIKRPSRWGIPCQSPSHLTATISTLSLPLLHPLPHSSGKLLDTPSPGGHRALSSYMEASGRFHNRASRRCSCTGRGLALFTEGVLIDGVRTGTCAHGACSEPLPLVPTYQMGLRRKARGLPGGTRAGGAPQRHPGLGDGFGSSWMGSPKPEAVPEGPGATADGPAEPRAGWRADVPS